MSHPLVDLYQIRIGYTFSALNHVFQTWVKPSAFTTVPTGAISDYDVTTRAGSLAADLWLNSLMPSLKGLFAATTTFNTAELWAYNAGSPDGIFLGASTLADVGTNAGANTIASQAIFTGRTTSGRIKKFYAEEGAFTAGNPITWDAGAGAYNTFGAFVISSNGGAMVDRVGSPVVALSQVFPGQNEASFKRRYRPSN